MTNAQRLITYKEAIEFVEFELGRYRNPDFVMDKEDVKNSAHRPRGGGAEMSRTAKSGVISSSLVVASVEVWEE